MKKKGSIWIGTSNVVIPGNRQSFPEEFRKKSRLHYYSHLFPTVEINSSFYKNPLASTYRKWSEDVTEGFRFSIKLSKSVTHEKELKYDPSLVRSCLEPAEGLANKKGCLLIQLPGKINLDYFSKLEKLLERVDKLNTKKPTWRLAIEFRNADWYIRETEELLDEFTAALVFHDIPKGKIEETRVKAGFIYMRFHGPTGNYRGSYTEQQLKQKARMINEWRKQGKDVYAYFNNTIGSAFDNARRLQQLTDHTAADSRT